jgi:tetratricopeptide (TPR) repeat protein
MNVRRARLTAVVLLVLLVAGGAAAQEPDIRSVLKENAEQIRKVREQLAARPSDSRAWTALVEMERWRAVYENVLAAQETGAPAANGDDAARAAVERVCQEWRRAAPDDAGPLLALAPWLRTPEERSALIAEAVERFPRSAEAVEARAMDLARTGEHEARRQLLEDFLARNPDNPEAYRLLAGSYGWEGRGREVVEAWRSRFPGDPRAVRAALEAQLPGKDPDEARRLAAAAVEAVATSPGAESVCEALEHLADGAVLPESSDCYLRVLKNAEGDAVGRAAAGYARVAALRGDRSGLQAALSALPASRRTAARVSVGSALAAHGECDEAVAVLREVRGDRSEDGSVDFALSYCAESPAARRLFLDRLAAAPADRIEGMVTTGAKLARPEEIEPVLLARLRREPGQAGLWQAVDRLYEKAGLREQRLAHLQAWLEADPVYHGTARHAALADLLLRAGRPEEAIASLQAVSRQEGAARDVVLQEKLGLLLLAAGRFAEAEALADRFLSQAGEAPDAPWAHRFRARAALARNRPEEALAAYRRFFEEANAWYPDAAGEVGTVLIGLGREKEVPRTLEELMDAASANGVALGRRAELLAETLDRLGLETEALAAYERALEKAPADARLQDAVARVAEEAGHPERVEQALRALVALAPENPVRWSSLADWQRRQGRPDLAIATIEEGLRAVGRPAPDLQMTLARAYLDRKEPGPAIRILREMIERNPQDGTADEELSRAYRMLGEGGG